MTMTATRKTTVSSWLLGALALASYLILSSVSVAQAKPTCGGKPATIVSNAAKIVGTKGHDVIVAGPGDNVIYGLGGNDTICAGAGDDVIHGGRGNDLVYGGPGNDRIYGGRGSDELHGGRGTDRIFGELGNDRLFGGPGDGDLLEGGQGDDRLFGGPGDGDILVGGPGRDFIDGGPGAHDIVSYRDAGGPVTIDLGKGRVSGAEQERLRGIEDALGGSGDDTLIGSAAANRLDGGPGDDTLIAVGNGDEAFGGAGHDVCSGPFISRSSCGAWGGSDGTAVAMVSSITGAASLVITGSDGPDNVAVSFTGQGYLLEGGNGIEVLLGQPGEDTCLRDTLANSVFCEGEVSTIQASMGAGNDTFTVADSVPASVSSTIDGGPGSDTLRGGRGNDVIYGGNDRDPDTLEGGAGDDVLFGVNIFHPQGDSGAATMIGGPGDDLMVGGQPCNGDTFIGGPGDNDSASFARVRNSGIHVKATIGGAVIDPDVPNCNAGRIDSSTEKIEGSPGPDILIGDDGPNTLLGRGGNDIIDGRGGFDRCIGGQGKDRISNCETDSWRTPLRNRIR